MDATPKARRPVDRIGIIGDVHGEEQCLAAALGYLAEADCILCTGDVVDGHGSADVCAQLLQEHGAITVAGNHERWLFTDKMRHIADADRRQDLQLTTLSFLASLPQCVELPTTDGRLLLSHGVGRNDIAQVWPGSERLGAQPCEALDDLLQTQRYKYLVHGHIHYRLVLEFQNLTLINPGALKRNLQPGFKSGFMLLDTTKQELECWHLNENCKVIEKGFIPLAKRTQTERIWQNTQEFDGNWNIFRMTDYMKPI